MTQDRLSLFRSTLAAIAKDWSSNSQGQCYDSGHSDSEIRSAALTGFLDKNKNEQDLDVLFDRLQVFQQKAGAEHGDWKNRQYAREATLTGAWGNAELDRALRDAGFAQEIALAEQRCVQSLQSFHAQAPRPGNPAGALRFDVQAYLDDPKTATELSVYAINTYRAALDEAGPEASFRVLGRTLNAASRSLIDGGHKQQTSGMQNLLRNFGNPDSALFGLTADANGTRPERRYRRPGS